MVQQSKVRDWKGNILGLNVTFGSPNIYKRYQSNLQSSIDRITDLLDSTQPIPYNVLPPAIKVVTDALKSALTELEFTNGIIARDKMNPNYLVLFNSNGIGISRDGGSTFKEAITSEGFVLSAGAIGKLSANNIQIGAETTFETGYDPSQVKIELTNDLESIQDQIATLGGEIDESFRDGIIEEAEAIAIETQINLLNSENRSLERRYLNIYHNDFLASGVPKTALGAAKIDFDVKHADLINSITVSISDRKISDVEKTDFNKKFEAYTTALATLVDKLEICSDQITTRTANMAELNAKKYAEELKEVLDIDIEDMQDQISTLGGKIDESFRDGIIDEAEANAIELYINSLNAERENIDNRYTAIYDNVNLSGIPKNDLFTKKNTFNLAHTKLINSIDDALRDGKATDAEKTDIDEKFASYSSTLADLATSFEKAIDAISLKRATDATNSVREDLRLAAPLPTSLTLDQSGIRASTNNSNQYAQLDYRGLYIKQGAVQIERPDGYSVINNGIIQSDFAIVGALPPFRDGDVWVAGIWFACQNAAPRNIDFLSFKHDSRYFVVRVAQYSNSVGVNSSFYVYNVGGDNLLANRHTTNTNAGSHEATFGVELTVDLGPPTGEITSIYLRMATGTAGATAYARILRVYKWG